MRRLLTELASASGGGEHLSGLVSAAQDRLLSMGIPPPSDPRHFDDPGALLLLAALHDLLFLARPEVGGLRPALRAARTALAAATAQVLKNGLGLLGVSAPEKM